MKTRLITAAVGIVIAITVFLLSEMDSIVMNIAITLVSAVMCSEFLSAKKLHKNLWIFLPCILFGALIPLLSYSGLGLIPFFVFTLYICVFAIKTYTSVPLDDIIFAYFGVTVLSGSMALFTLRACALNYHPSFWAVLILGVPWIADSAAYFIGNAVGKRKLSPVISPKKTVEGALGGVLCATVSPFLFAFVFMLIYGNTLITWWVLPIIGFVNAILSIVGDLLFSVVKRSCGIKDFGSVMPGHGGLLDRFDSVILCVPVVYMISQYVTIIT